MNSTSIAYRNEQYRRLMVARNEKTEYRLLIYTKESPEGKLAIQTDRYDYLKDRGEDWKRMNFINDYIIETVENI